MQLLKAGVFVKTTHSRRFMMSVRRGWLAKGDDLML
jgi:hypothetical protein